MVLRASRRVDWQISREDSEKLLHPSSRYKIPYAVAEYSNRSNEPSEVFTKPKFLQ
jgi:hypothetical protein